MHTFIGVRDGGGKGAVAPPEKRLIRALLNLIRAIEYSPKIVKGLFAVVKGFLNA